MRILGSDPGLRTFSFQMPNQSWQAQMVMAGRARTVSQVNLVRRRAAEPLLSVDGAGSEPRCRELTLYVFGE